MTPSSTQVYNWKHHLVLPSTRIPTMKDLSFILPIIDRHWLGLTVQPSKTGDRVTLVVRHDGPWWAVFFNHVEWRVKPEHPVDRWLLDVAARHSS